MGQCVGAGVELRVSHGLCAKQQSGRLGRAGDLRFDQLLQAGVGRVIDLSGVPIVNLSLNFTGIEHRQLANPAVAVVHQCAQQIAPVTCHAGDGAGVEQVIGIGQRRVQTPAFFVSVQAQVELSGAPFPFNQAQLQT